MVDIKRNLVFTSNVTAAVNGLKQVENAEKGVIQQTNNLNKLSKDYAATSEKALAGVRGSVDKTITEFNELRESELGALDALEKYNKEAKNTRAAPQSTPNAFGREQVGDFSTFLSSTASVAGGAFQESFAFGADVFGVLEYVDRFKEGVKLAGEAALNAGGLVGSLANAGASIASVIPGVSTSFGALTAVALPVAGVVLAAVAAIDTYNRSIEQSKIALAGAIDGQKRYYDLLLDGTTEQATAEVDRSRRESALLEQRKQEILNAQQKAFEFTQKGQGDLAARVLEGVADVTGAFGDLDSELKAIDQQLQSNSIFVERATAGIKDNAFAYGDLILKQEEYRDTIETSQQSIQNYTDQIDQLNEAFTSNKIRAAVDTITKNVFDAMEASITAAEKAEDALIARQEREDAYYKRINDIQEQSNQRAIDTQESIDKLNAQAQFDEEKALKEFNERIAKIEADARRKREDAELSLSEARLRFDPLAAKRAQNELERIDKEERKAKRKAGREFDDDKAERDRVLAEKIAALQLELAEFQTMQQGKLDAEKVAFEESERRLEEREARNEQRANDRADRRESYEDALADRREQRAQTDHDKQINRLEGLRDAEVERIETLNAELALTDFSLAQIAGSAEKIAEVAGELVAAAEKLGYDPYAGTRPPIAGGERDSGGTGEPGKAYLIGRRAQPELFVPSSLGTFYPNADRMGSRTTIINVDAYVGENVTPSDIKKLASDLRHEYQQGDENVELGVKTALKRGKRPTTRRR